MTVWIMHIPLSEMEEKSFTQRTDLPLPFDDLPDLSAVNNGGDLRRLLTSLNPDSPPETIGRLHDRVWRILGELQPEDVIAVPLPRKRVMAVAEVSGRYGYDMNRGPYAHYIPVKWQQKTIPFIRFRLHKPLIESSGWSVTEVKEQSARAIIQSSLPYKYNRFAGLKWIVLIYTAAQLIRVLFHK